MWKNIAGRVLAFWTLLVFVSTLLIVSLIALVIGLWPEPKRSVWMHKVFAGWMHFFFFLNGVKRTIRGKHYFQKGHNYIVVCNHNSFMDVPLSSTAIPGANKTIAKMEMARIPIFGLVYKRGSVLVDRKNEESRKASYTKMKQVLKMGLHMCIYPEGTRNKTAELLRPFHDGAFKLAVETGTAIIPALIFHTTNVLPRNKAFYFWPYPIDMHFLPPVSAQNKKVQQLKEEVFTLMKDYYRQNR